jgi:uncharacterized protein (DUF2235 family)
MRHNMNQRNIVVCSDGTTNAFGYGDTNVATLIRALDASQPARQLVFYDQGIGSEPKRVDRLKEHKSDLGAAGEALTILPPPVEKFPARITRLRGQLLGYGLKENLREMYRALCAEANCGDRIFLFGFSRGAFTVRALAGLLYHCDVLTKTSVSKEETFDRLFEVAYGLFTSHYTDRDNRQKTQAFKEAHTAQCPIAFLGVWDTVKSYGGIDPVTLPHLRHNASVERICHATAMDEHRTWFKHTTWGWLDSDAKNAEFFAGDPRYSTQQIKEVWFPGYHADVGAGGPDTWPFHWLFNEACEPSLGLLLNSYGKTLLNRKVLAGTRGNPRDSEHFLWKLSNLVPRLELDNEHRTSDGSASKRRRWGATGKRDLNSARRGKFVSVHSSVGSIEGISNVNTEVSIYSPERGWTV